MRALEKHPGDRYSSAGDMMQELEDFLAEARLRTSSLRIGRYVKELFAKEVHVSPEDAKRAAEFGEGGVGPSGGGEAEEDLDFDRRQPPLLSGMEDEPEIQSISDDMEEPGAQPPPPEEEEN